MESSGASFNQLKAVSLVVEEKFTEAFPLIMQLDNQEYAELVRETTIPTHYFQEIESSRSSAAKSAIITFVAQDNLEEAALLVVRLNNEDYYQVLYCAVLHGDASWFSSLLGWHMFQPAYLIRFDDEGVNIFSHVLTSKCKSFILAMLKGLAAAHQCGKEIIFPPCASTLCNSLGNTDHAVIEDLLIELLSKKDGHMHALLLMRCINSGVSLSVFSHNTAIKFSIAHDYKKLFIAYFLVGLPLYHFKKYMDIGSDVANFYLPLLDAFEVLVDAGFSGPAIPFSDPSDYSISEVRLTGVGHSRMFLSLPLRADFQNHPDIFQQFFPALKRLAQVQQPSWGRAHDVGIVYVVTMHVIEQKQFESYPGFAELFSVLKQLHSQFEKEFHSGAQGSVFSDFSGASEYKLELVNALKQFVFSITKNKYDDNELCFDDSQVTEESEVSGRLAFSVKNNAARINAPSPLSGDAAASVAATVSDFLLTKQACLDSTKQASPTKKKSLKGRTSRFLKDMLPDGLLPEKSIPSAPQTR